MHWFQRKTSSGRIQFQQQARLQRTRKSPRRRQQFLQAESPLQSWSAQHGHQHLPSAVLTSVAVQMAHAFVWHHRRIGKQTTQQSLQRFLLCTKSSVQTPASPLQTSSCSAVTPQSRRQQRMQAFLLKCHSQLAVAMQPLHRQTWIPSQYSSQHSMASATTCVQVMHFQQNSFCWRRLHCSH
ncbi:unannotated protein [freshwater metagenome]|uniref:Unannotated protein n=1 Tax=freshwater metagenome TaxID=449393 RepID=A0A6J6LS05_9ZZZZ